jgi:hypothetical protein
MSTKMTRERAEEPWDRNTVGRRPDCSYSEVILMTGSEQIKPIEDARGISAITYGFIALKALFAALDTLTRLRISRAGSIHRLR